MIKYIWIKEFVNKTELIWGNCLRISDNFKLISSNQGHFCSYQAAVFFLSAWWAIRYCVGLALGCVYTIPDCFHLRRGKMYRIGLTCTLGTLFSEHFLEQSDIVSLRSWTSRGSLTLRLYSTCEVTRTIMCHHCWIIANNSRIHSTITGELEERAVAGANLFEMDYILPIQVRWLHHTGSLLKTIQNRPVYTLLENFLHRQKKLFSIV